MKLSLGKIISLACGSITRRLYLHTTIVAIFLLVVITITIWTGNTLTMITAIARFERTHTVSLVEALVAFIEYHEHKKPEDLESFHAKMAITQSYNRVFSRLLDMRKDTPEAEFVRVLERTFSETDHKTAVIIVNRIKVLYWHPILKALVADAAGANAAGEKLKVQVAHFLATNNEVEQAALFADIYKTRKESILYETSFSKGCSALSNEISSYINYITIALLIISVGFTGFLAYMISKTVIKEAGRYTSDLEKEIQIRKQTEEALIESKTLVEAVVENAPLMIFLKEATDLRFVLFNSAGEELLGYDRELLLGKNDLDLFPPEQAANFVAKDREVLDGEPGILDIPEEPVMTKKNGLRFLHTRKVCIRGGDGVTKYLLGISEDITERKRDKEIIENRLVSLTQPLDSGSISFEELFNLDELQHIQNAFAEATGVASIITTPEGIPLTRPSNFCRLCKDIIRTSEKGLANCIKSDSVLGEFNPSGPVVQPCMSGGLWDGGASITVGGRHIANWLIGQVRNEAQDEEKMLEYADEINVDRELFRTALAEVTTMSKERFDKVALSLYLLANELSQKAYQNIQQARFIAERNVYEKELQQKNAELERFTYTVSHDLKSPIITIKGFTGSMEKDLLNGNYQRMPGDLKRVKDAADKMSYLLRDLLELSTIGRIINVPEVADMNLLIGDVLAQLAGPLKNHNLTVTVQSVLPTVFCDRQRMAEVLQNLLENAIKYMGDQTEPCIQFGMRTESGENIFFVQDNGIGIDEKYHQIIFGLFNKLDAGSEGTGIGLALVKRIIELHGGRVWVESEGEGKGSRFCFTIKETQQ